MVLIESAPLGKCSFPSLMNQFPDFQASGFLGHSLEHSTQATSDSRYLAALMKSSVLYSGTHTHRLDWATNKPKQ